MSPFDFPEVREMFDHLFDTLLDESERGAIIIGTAKVEEQLSNFIGKILPNSSKRYRKKMLDYPGVLSSFSSKIELAYSFRLISENLYTSLNSLRKIRNDAAHSSQTFSIAEIRDRFENIFDLGPSIPIFIRNEAMKLMVELKMEGIKHIFEEYELTEEEKKEQLIGISENKELMEKIEKQVPRWELIFGLSFICGIIKKEEEETMKLLGKAKTWNSLYRQMNNEDEKST